MKLFRFGSTALLSVVAAGALAAQAPQTPPAAGTAQQPRTPQPATRAADAAEMTVVGCLAPTAGATDSYTLTVTPPDLARSATAAGSAAAAATRDATRAGSPASKPDDAARTAMSSTPAKYKIVGLSNDQLKPHVNHQVELKGRVNASASPAGAASSMTAQEFRATTLKMVSATCPPAK
jgi:hypothetical protein